MTITLSNLQPIVALIAGILILIMPRLLNFIVALYLHHHRPFGARHVSLGGGAEIPVRQAFVPVERTFKTGQRRARK